MRQWIDLLIEGTKVPADDLPDSGTQSSSNRVPADDAPSGGNQSSTNTAPKKKTGPKLVINTFNTVYPVVTDAAKNIGFRCKQVDPNLYINPY